MSFFKPRIQSKLIMAFLIMGFIPMILSTLIVVKTQLPHFASFHLALRRKSLKKCR